MNHGEPAFPAWEDFPSAGGGFIWKQKAPGMTLRDYFAIRALHGFLSNPQLAGGEPKLMSKDAYDYADAMIQQREKKN